MTKFNNLLIGEDFKEEKQHFGIVRFIQNPLPSLDWHYVYYQRVTIVQAANPLGRQLPSELHHHLHREMVGEYGGVLSFIAGPC